jgi:NitT/TauT family transport system substrate-binding protein
MQRNNRLWLYGGLVLLVAVLVLVVAIPGWHGTGKKPDSSLQQVKIAQWGQEKYLIYLPVYVAMEKGYFKDAGLEVTLTFTGNDDQTFAAVISGDAQFGIGDPVFTAISQERGFPAKVVATVVDGVAIWGVTNKPNVPEIAKPEQLAGLRVGTFPEPSTNYTLMKELLTRHGEVLKGTTIIQAPIGSQLALLESGKADIAMELEPATSIAVSKGYRVVYSSPRFHGPFAFTGLTVTEQLTRDNPDLVQKMVSALEKAVVACHRDPAVAVSVTKSLFPNLPEGVVDVAVRRMLTEKTFPEHVEVGEEAWQKALRVRLAVGDLKGPQDTAVSVDNRFAVTARQASK